LGNLIVEGAMLNDPERVRITAPAAGRWEAVVKGFAVFTKSDKYKLRIAIDDKVLH
jgi:hypothetical protein